MDLRWTSSKVECYSESSQLPRESCEFYTSFLWNEQHFKVGEFALIKDNKNGSARIGRISCAFGSRSKANYKCWGIVRWYIWARTLREEMSYSKLKFYDEEIVENSSEADTLISLNDITNKCSVTFTTLDESNSVIETIFSSGNFICRYKISDAQLVPYFREDFSMCLEAENYSVTRDFESSNEKLTSSWLAETTNKTPSKSTQTPSKRKANYDKRYVIVLDSEGSDVEENYASKVKSLCSPLKNMKLTPKGNNKENLRQVSPRGRNLSVKRVLNDSFGSPTSPSGIPIYSIINSNDDTSKDIKIKLKLTEKRSNLNLKVHPTKLDDEIVDLNEPLKVEDLENIKNKVCLSPSFKREPRQLRPYTPGKVASRRRSTRTQRKSYVDYFSPEQLTPKKKFPLKWSDNDQAADDDEDYKLPNQFLKNVHVQEEDSKKETQTPIRCVDVMEDTKRKSIQFTKNSSKLLSPLKIYSPRQPKSIRKCKPYICGDIFSEEKLSESLETTTASPQKQRNVRKSIKSYKNCCEPLSEEELSEPLKTTSKSPRKLRSTRKSNKIYDDTTSEEELSEPLKATTDSPRKLRSTRKSNQSYKIYDDPLSEEELSEALKTESKSPRKTRRTRKLNKICDDTTSEKEFSEPLKTTSRSPQKQRSTRKSNKICDDATNQEELNGPPKTPTRKKHFEAVSKAPAKSKYPSDEEMPLLNLHTPRKGVTSTPKNTPSRAKMVREGIITPSVQARNKAIVKDNTPLAKARTQLHVSLVPKSLPCREKEFDDIINFIEGKLLDGCGGCMYVSGVPGTGKTATTTEVIRKLQESMRNKTVPEFTYIDINGMRLSEPRQAYVEIMRQLTGKTIHWEQAQAQLENRFVKGSKNTEPIVLVVDELDILCTKRQDVVYNILDWPTKAKAQLVVITIANTMDLPERLLMGRVTSRLGLTRLTFQAYTHKQLQEIVTKRLIGITAFSADAVQLVARKVASVSGDARRALDICRRAVEIAETEGKNTLVSMSHVSKALNAMMTQPKVQAIKHCSRLEQLILQAVVAEIERTGVEETNFCSVLTMLISIVALDGFQMVSSTAAMRAVAKLGACRLLLLDQKCNNIHQRIILNVSADDVYYALNKTDI